MARDRLLHRRQLQRRAMAVAAAPDLGDPDRLVVLRIARDHVAEAARHRADVVEQQRDQGLALARLGGHPACQSVHAVASSAVAQRCGTASPAPPCGASTALA